MTAAKDRPALTEREFMRWVTDLASVYGWTWAHFRPAQTERGWRTPVSGPLGKGFPDLVLARARDGRLIFAELKTDTGRVTAEQAAALAVLSEVGVAYLWRPADFDDITKVLR